jgi:hypothetical protein
MGGLICNINKMSLILVAKNESGNKQKANPPAPAQPIQRQCNTLHLTLSQFKA